ncbi:MAG: nucleoside kinase, partial [Alistipes sp.]|nr:nucleoside kinase [Alistipes sp.]
METVKVICQNTSSVVEVAAGTSLLELEQRLALGGKYPILAAYVNNRIKELNYKIYKPLAVRFIDITHFEGYRVYQRTISFIAHKAVRDLWHDRKFYIRHTVGRGFYCEFDDEKELTQDEIEALRSQMQRIIDARYPIHRHRMLTAEINGIYERFGFDDKIALLNSRPRLYSDIYCMDDMVGYFYGALTPNTGYIHLFDLRSYYNGFYIALPLQNNPDTLDLDVEWDKMFDVFHEYHRWVKIMGVPTVGQLNRKILGGDGSELIKIAEAFH